MDLGIKGRRAIVTGGSTGIGRATARELLLEGVHVAICARDAARLEQTRKELAADPGGEVLAVPTDMRNPADIARLVGRGNAVVSGASTSWSTTPAPSTRAASMRPPTRACRIS